MYTYNYKLTTEQSSLIIAVPKDLNKLDIYKAEKYQNMFAGYKVFFNVQNTTDKTLKFYVKNSLLCVVSPKSDFSCQLPQNVFTDYMIECQIVKDDSVLILGANNEIIVTFTEWQGLGFNNNYNNNQLQRNYIKSFVFDNKNDIQKLSKISGQASIPFFNVVKTFEVNAFTNYIKVVGVIDLFIKSTNFTHIQNCEGNGNITMRVNINGDIIVFVLFSFLDENITTNDYYRTTTSETNHTLLGLVQKEFDKRIDINNYVSYIDISYYYDRKLIGNGYNSYYA